MAWYSKNSGSKTHPVGQKQANSFGLYDMEGNVSEWCEDVWHENYDGAPSDGSAWKSGGDSSHQVVRGSSLGDPSNFLGSARRHKYLPVDRYASLGIRVVASSRS
jgi:formylglycine-generating enzyme required for sulfatase activity